MISEHDFKISWENAHFFGLEFTSIASTHFKIFSGLIHFSNDGKTALPAEIRPEAGAELFAKPRVEATAPVRGPAPKFPEPKVRKVMWWPLLDMFVMNGLGGSTFIFR